MKLKFIGVEGNGNLQTEVVWFDVLEDTALGNYLVCDTFFTQENHIAGELRHTYWFPPTEVKKGDFVALHTRSGDYTTTTTDRETASHHFYWGLNRSVWNSEHDCAVIFHVDSWKTQKALEF